MPLSCAARSSRAPTRSTPGPSAFITSSDDDLLEAGITGVRRDPRHPRHGDRRLGAEHGRSPPAQAVTVTFGPSLKAPQSPTARRAVDLLASFSSRGVRQAEAGQARPRRPRRHPVLGQRGHRLRRGQRERDLDGLPDAPPASPRSSGAAHPEWTTEEVKADLMNTAVHDVFTGQGQTGLVYGPNRVGAGRGRRPRGAGELRARLRRGRLRGGVGVLRRRRGRRRAGPGQAGPSRWPTRGRAPRSTEWLYDPLVQQPGVTYALSAPQVTVPRRPDQDAHAHDDRRAGRAAQGGRPDGARR